MINIEYFITGLESVEVVEDYFGEFVEVHDGLRKLPDGSVCHPDDYPAAIKDFPVEYAQYKLEFESKEKVNATN